MRIIRMSSAFDRDVRRLEKQGKDANTLFDIVEMIRDGKPLPEKHKDHPLRHDKAGKRDCHISPDWVLIYHRNDEEVYLHRTGSHAELFGK